MRLCVKKCYFVIICIPVLTPELRFLRAGVPIISSRTLYIPNVNYFKHLQYLITIYFIKYICLLEIFSWKKETRKHYL